MAVQQPEANWSDKYRENDSDSPEEAARKRKLWRRNAGLSQAWQDEQLSVQDITSEEDLAEALERMGVFNVKEEGQAGFRRIMQRGLGYQQNLQRGAEDYYNNLWSREGLQRQANGVWKDVRPDGSIVYRDSQGWETDAGGKRSGRNYIGSLYNVGRGAYGGATSGTNMQGYRPSGPDMSGNVPQLPGGPVPPNPIPPSPENPTPPLPPDQTPDNPQLPGFPVGPTSFGSTSFGVPAPPSGIPNPTIPASPNSVYYPSPGAPGTRSRNGSNSIPIPQLPGLLGRMREYQSWWGESLCKGGALLDRP